MNKQEVGRSKQSQRDDERIALEIMGLDQHTDPFVAAVHATRMPMIITNPRLDDNPVVFANDAFVRLSGYSRDEIVGRNCRFLQRPETDPATVRRIHDAVERAEPIEIDIRNHRRDGEPFWNRLLMAPVFDADQKLAYFFASQVDVTIERERMSGLERDNATLLAELTDRLRAQQERELELDFALRAGRFGTWSIELATGALVSSEQCRALFGLSPHAPFSYEDRLAAIDRRDRAKAEEALERTVREGVEYEVEYRVIWPDGSTHWLASRGQPFFDADGRALRVSGVSLDITSVRLAERRKTALAELTDRFRDLSDAADISYAAAECLATTLDVSRAGYGWVDRDAETINIQRDWNAPGVSSIAGVLSFRDYGSYIDDLKRGDPAVVGDARTDPRTSETAGALESISARSFINMPLTEDDGLVALIFVNHDKPRVWTDDDLDFMRDVAERTRIATERRRAEWELADLAASLEEQVAQRTAELMTAEEALRQSQKMEAVGQLTGGLAHDFNNLLTVIRGSVDLLRRPNLAEDRRVRYIDAIADTADRAATLTSQLLAFARRQALRPEAFDARDSVLALQQMVRTLAGSMVSLRLDVPDTPCVVHADRSQFDTAIVNMAVNARDAMNGQGELIITVDTATERPAIRNHSSQAGNFVTVSVRDTGTGIASGQIDKIFEPFFTTKEVGQGTGLGLSQVIGFAKQSGGDVIVNSEVGHGAEFTMYIPQSDMAPGPAESKSARSEGGNGACVLVVEDNPDVGMFATQALKELGYTTVLAADGHAALEQLSAGRTSFDIVFSDVVMPGMSGLELREKIHNIRPSLPVLLTSGYSDVVAEHGAEGIELLNKPYSIDELSLALEKLRS